jgi:hypothetical protein
MNERIRELEKQAIDALRHKPFSMEQFREKFAELIVRRCINIACEYDKPKLSGPGLAIACNIESHFDIYIEEDGRFVK